MKCGKQLVCSVYGSDNKSDSYTAPYNTLYLIGRDILTCVVMSSVMGIMALTDTYTHIVDRRQKSGEVLRC